MRKTFLAITVVITLVSCKKEEMPTSIEENLSPIEKLIAGNQRFLEEKTIHPHQNKNSILKNQNSQHPFAVIVTCSDSRVAPEILFDQGIGDLFVIRNAGNLISDIDMGSIEYAVEHLDAKLIVVLGHTECGAIKAYISDKNNDYKKHHNHIDYIVETIANEQEEKQEERLHLKEKNLLGCINANIDHSAKSIKKNPTIKKHKTIVIAMSYDVHTGKIKKIK
jgi:carbonic anhydrase